MDAPALDLYNPVMSSSAVRTETPAPAVPNLLTDHWTQPAGYHVWRPSGSRDYLLIFTVAGSGRMTWERSHIDTKVGDVTIYRPSSPQDYQTSPLADHWEMIWAHLQAPATWQPYLPGPEALPGLWLHRLEDPAIRERVQRRLAEMVRAERSTGLLRIERAMNALEAALLLLAEASSTFTRSALSDRLDPRLAPALERIHQQLDQPITVDDLARAAHLSPSRFAHLFRQQLGRPPLQYLHDQRIQRARQLLERTGLSIAQVAERVGYHDPFYFSRRFHDHAGQSPSDYRRQAHALTPPTPIRP